MKLVSGMGSTGMHHLNQEGLKDKFGADDGF